MRILILSNVFPFPIQQGYNLRIFHVSRCLSVKHEVDLLCFGESQELPAEISNIFNNVFFYENEFKIDEQGIDRLQNYFSLEQLMPYSRKVFDYLIEADVNNKYDVIFTYTGMLPSMPTNLVTPVFADLVDDSVLEYWRELRVARSPRKIISLIKWLIMSYLFEKKYFKLAKEVVTVSEVDAKFFTKVLPSVPISVIQNGVDVDFFRPLGLDEIKNSIVFEGRMDFTVNTDGMLYFCKDIFPLILKEMPEVVLYIVGKNPTEEIRVLASSSIKVTGYVDDVRNYIDQSCVFICPLRKGGGIKNKILQAWAMGKAVVATEVSIGGLPAHDGENILVRNTPKDFSDAVVNLLKDEINRNNIGRKAREVILNGFSWESKIKELECIFKKNINDH